MRQRSQPSQQQVKGTPRSQLVQRRLVGREPSSENWEITLERSTISDPSTHSHEEPRVGPQHAAYQNGTSVEQFFHSREKGASVALDKPQLENFHLLHRTPLLVPDKRYRAFLQGQSARKKRRPNVTDVCLAQGCALFSAVATLFLLFVGVILDAQPLYIKGALPGQMIQTEDGRKPVLRFLLPVSQRLPSAVSAYRAGIAYTLTACACLYYVYPRWCGSQIYRWKKKYQNIPDSDVLPLVVGADVREVSSYQPSLWNRGSAWVRQWLAQRPWYSKVHNLRPKQTPKMV